jgi:hypothetical protein
MQLCVSIQEANSWSSSASSDTDACELLVVSVLGDLLLTAVDAVLSSIKFQQ